MPPSFPVADPNKLIKPSEYLRSISGGEKRNEIIIRERSVSREETSEEMDEETGNGVGEKPAGPPPPPLPEFNGNFLRSLLFTTNYSNFS